MPSPLEQTFRRFLTVMAVQKAADIPPYVHESIVDHLSRTDATGATLCFYSPLREQLLDIVEAWLTTPRQPGEQLTLL